jgi:hypothetical protein
MLEAYPMKNGRLIYFALIVLFFSFQSGGIAQEDKATVLENRLKSAPQGQKVAIARELGQYYRENAVARLRSGDEKAAREYFDKYDETQTRLADAQLQTELDKLKKSFARSQRRKDAQTVRRLSELERYIGYLLGILLVIGVGIFRMRQRNRKALADQEMKLREALKTLQSVQRRLEEAERTADIGDLAIDHIRQLIPELTELKERFTVLTAGAEDGNEQRQPSGDPAAELEKLIAKLDYFREVAGF